MCFRDSVATGQEVATESCFGQPEEPQENWIAQGAHRRLRSWGWSGTRDVGRTVEEDYTRWIDSSCDNP